MKNFLKGHAIAYPNAVAFDPATIRILTAAFDEAWQSLQKSSVSFKPDGQAEATRERLAMRIVEMAALGERDKRRLRDDALVHLTQSNLRNAARERHQDDYDRGKRERRHQEEALDDALKNTFPASDPVSIVQPAPAACIKT